MTIQRILNLKVQGAVHITPDATIVELIQSHEFEDEGALIVSSDGNTVEGIISQRDIVRGLKRLGSTLLSKSVRELMATELLTCTPDNRAAGIMALMISKHMMHLPVVSDGKLVGMVSVPDLLRLHLEETLSEAEAMRSYITG